MAAVRVKIYGAGSIGNHLTQACRRNGWDVAVVDRDAQALKRMKEDIYPVRYGEWDEGIALYELKNDPRGGFDVVMIGTPPDIRLSLATEVLRLDHPRVLFMEKPLCALQDADRLERWYENVRYNYPDISVLVGYNHALGENTEAVTALLREKVIGEVITIDVEFREHWGGIFAAHPWLSGPKDSYLGSTRRGGGALGEHSHATHLWLHLARLAGLGEIFEVSAFLDFNDLRSDFDRIAALNLRTTLDRGGRVIQDVVTKPPRKWARLQGSDGYIEWQCGFQPNLDRVVYESHGSTQEIMIPRTRPDEFFREIRHIEDILTGKLAAETSPISLQAGMRVMRVLIAAFNSHCLGASKFLK